MGVIGRAVRSRATVPLSVSYRRLATQNSRGRTIIRDPRKAKKRPPPVNRAVEEIPQPQEAPPSKYQPYFNFDQAPKQSLTSSMAQTFTWGFGITIAFVAVASIFS